MITLIAATDKNGLIGNNGNLPWKIPEDMEFFKKVTTGNIVVMGRKTYISIGQPLKNRVNVLISETILETFNPEKNIEDYMNEVVVVKSFEKILNHCFDNKNMFIIGGRSIYEQALNINLPDRILLSKIDGEFEGNQYMPEIPKEYVFKQCFKISDRVNVWEFRK